jgi:3-hydroxyisobutyrate dehydrogenase-like beta-hydroxyacid dehydrogenase
MSRPIGLIGVGLMGTAIAERLRKHGFELIGWDLNPEQLAELVRMGGRSAENIEQVFSDCDFVVLSLPNDEIVRGVLEEQASQLRSGQFLIDTSTGDPRAVVTLADALCQRGIDYLDATISGSSAQVRDGSAVALVGATDAALNACRSILTSVAPQVLHVGPPGSGSQMKLVTNLVLGLNRAALAEGFAFAESLGLSLESSLAVLKSSMAYSRIMDTKGSKMIAREYSPQAKVDQHAKDVKLMLASARLNHLELPLCETHLKLLQRASQLGFGDADNSAIIEAYHTMKQTDESEP